MEEKKISILLTAERIFAEKGINGTRMEDIASKAGISKKTLYVLFRSKDILVEQVYLRKLEEFSMYLDKVVTSDKPVLVKILNYLDTAFVRLDTVTPPVLQQIRRSYPNLIKHINKYIEESTFKRIFTLINELKEEGYLQEGITIESLLLLYRNNITNFLTNQFVIRREDSSVEHTDPRYLFCQSIITLFRGLINNLGLADFNEKVKTHERLNIYYKSV